MICYLLAEYRIGTSPYTESAYVDKHKYKDKTKFGDWKIMEEYLENEAFLFILDIKQGHCHISIRSS